MTTLIDVLVKPFCRDLSAARRRARSARSSGDIPFLIMQSNGGIVKHPTAGERPVTMLLSGPAAGVLGSMHTGAARRLSRHPHYRRRRHLDRRLLIENHQPPLHADLDGRELSGQDADARHRHRRNRRRLDRLDRLVRQLKVGPQSAGANPGPICYGKGGTKPTVTDAAVVLGRLPAAPGRRRDRARRRRRARRRSSCSARNSASIPDELAAGALEIAAANQVFGIRQVTTVRGREPGDYCDGRLRRRGRVVRRPKLPTSSGSTR